MAPWRRSGSGSTSAQRTPRRSSSGWSAAPTSSASTCSRARPPRRVGPFSCWPRPPRSAPGCGCARYVLNAGFWNPALLATRGRHARPAFWRPGRAWARSGPHEERARRRGAAMAAVQAADRGCSSTRSPRSGAASPTPGRAGPVQRPVPLMVAAMSAAGLAVAARHADIVGFAGLRQVPGASRGTFTLVGAAETAERWPRSASRRAGAATGPTCCCSSGRRSESADAAARDGGGRAAAERRRRSWTARSCCTPERRRGGGGTSAAATSGTASTA